MHMRDLLATVKFLVRSRIFCYTKGWLRGCTVSSCGYTTRTTTTTTVYQVHEWTL